MSHRHFGLMLILLLATTLACNAFSVAGEETLPPPPVRDETVFPPTDQPPTADSELLPTATERTPLPTFTPIVTTRDPNATMPPGTTVTATGTVTATATITPTATSAGPLSLSYTINWTVSDDDPAMSTAHVTLQAAGANGDYTYYHDDLVQPGPVFSFPWASCTNKPGSFRVDSSDGQSVRISYFERAPCPDPD